MGKVTKHLTRHDAADPDFARRVQAAYVTAKEAEQALIGTGTMSGSELARLRMLGRMGLLEGDGSSDDARRRMIQRRERTGE